MIRKYKASDAKSVKFIAYSEEQRGSMRAVCAERCDYYIDNEPEHCFVMVDEFDRPTGFALCSVDSAKFAALYPQYIEIIKGEDKRSYSSVKKLHKKIKTVTCEYPARIEISVLPSFQGKGIAKQLVNTIVEHLKSLGINGVYIVADTPAAVAFCERLGFVRIVRSDKTRSIYGMHTSRTSSV